MKALLELHLIQNFAPSNLNRDDTGSPKDAYFGGVRRARVSSQSFKRAMRMDFKERHLLTRDEIGERTKRAHEAIRDLLKEAGRGHEEAEKAAIEALKGVKLEVKTTKRKDGIQEKKTEYLVFLGRDELASFSQKILENWEGFEAHLKALEAEAQKKTPKAVDLPKELKANLLGALDGSRAVDIALFGRMLADLPDKNADAAAQVAHALGTHAMSRREFDFYTAVDDLKPNDTAGADMLGTVEFGSATFYRYLCIDLAKLRGNLGGDDDLVLRGLKALLYASVYAVPTGKQNTFAAHNLPSLISTVVRQDASPRNLANAFEVAVKAREGGHVAPSIEKLANEWDRQERIFGQGGRGRYVNAHDELEMEALGERQPNVETLIGSVLNDVRGVLGQLGQ
ncbi:type I-E CRISPR-associated protein Cas7/Cse4/CasC [Deinococcus aetherius]|uniref:Type I-E CRISPR-associated protein Cas7/Cse4/CasC n=1 Tax=Deinococcus aetherius TaxID=200252 RepID=A0ABM8AFI8_9DEIO|nr:type I-E CRISPR-associated protein Cas7/Cse4/CasC [Deinococcus aetherius]BDP42576.1 type I-E CRISPR-associated protein Cas7/Cse4/CasC [Deinococcus aetherius]